MVDISDGNQLRLGNSQDMMISHDGSSAGTIRNQTGELYLRSDGIRLVNHGNDETYIKCIDDGAVELYHDNDKVLNTITNGIQIDDGTSIFENSTHNTAIIQHADIHHSIILRGSTNANGQTITNDNVTTFREYGNFVFRTGQINAQERLIIESGGTSRFVNNVEGNSDENIAKFVPNGAVELYYDNSEKFRTTSAGVLVSGNVYCNDGNKFIAGTSNDLQIHHSNDNSYISDTGTGQLMIQASGLRLRNYPEGHTQISCQDDVVELYYDNSKKFETTNAGFALKEGNTTRLSFEYSNSLAFITANAGNEIKVSSGNGASNGIEFWDYSGVTKRCQIDGHGIKFGSDTAEANALQDYEEGTWTPIIKYNGGTGTAGANNYGYYTKVGNVVHVHATVHWTAIGGSTVNFARIDGLPYAYKNASAYRATYVVGGQLVGVQSGEHQNVALGSDANNSFLYITPFSNATTSGGNYSHYPTINSTGTIFGIAVTYLTN